MSGAGTTTTTTTAGRRLQDVSTPLRLATTLPGKRGLAPIRRRNKISAIDLVIDEDKEYRDLTRDIRHYFKS